MLQLKRVTLSHLDTLQALSKRIFIDAYAAENSPENMEKYLNFNLSKEKLTEEINNPHSEFYFAMQDGEAIGYLKVNYGPAQTDLQDDTALEIERIYVLKEYHGKQVGQWLLEQSVRMAKEKGLGYIWLGVWEKNFRAIRFYEKCGFQPFGTHDFVFGDEVQSDLMMRLDVKM